MGTIVFLILITLAATGIFGQGNINNSSGTKNEKEIVDEKNQYQSFKDMIENRDFVLEADYLRDGRGNRVFVSNTINFVAIDSTTVIIQVGSNSRIGPNGVGGVTAKGNITSWKLTEDPKNESFNLFATVMKPIGIYDLQFSISASGYSTALLTGLTMGELTFEGNVEPYTDSSVYEGSSL